MSPYWHEWMNEWVKERGRNTLHYSRMPTSKRRMSDGSRHSPLGNYLSCGWIRLEASKHVKAGGWRFDEEQDIAVVLKYLPTTNLPKTKEKTVSSWWSNLAGTRWTGQYCLPRCAILSRPQHPFCGFLAKKAQPESGHKEILGGSRLGGILQSEWPVLFKTVKVVKDGARLRTCSRLKDMNEAWQWTVSRLGSWTRKANEALLEQSEKFGWGPWTEWQH